ncbi:MAG TPA: hypothetical protein VGL73_15810 [Caulobacteraceae bacterium]|jgi:hypothetical protein
MAGAVMLWIGAAVGAGFTLSAQSSGEMRRYRGRRYYDQQSQGPLKVVRTEDPDAFQDGLLLRWAAVVVLALLGVAVAVAVRLGYFPN